MNWQLLDGELLHAGFRRNVRTVTFVDSETKVLIPADIRRVLFAIPAPVSGSGTFRVWPTPDVSTIIGILISATTGPASTQGAFVVNQNDWPGACIDDWYGTSQGGHTISVVEYTFRASYVHNLMPGD